MKKAILCLCIVCTVLLTSCIHSEIDNSMLVGKWVSINGAKDAALNLYIDELEIEVKNGSWDYRPFISDEIWEYYIDKDSVLNISRTEYDGDEYDTESYELDLSFSNSYNTLTLWYKPAFSSLRKYTFIRR